MNQEEIKAQMTSELNTAANRYISVAEREAFIAGALFAVTLQEKYKPLLAKAWKNG